MMELWKFCQSVPVILWVAVLMGLAVWSSFKYGGKH